LGHSIDAQQKRIHEFFDNDYIEIRNVNKDIAERSADVCRKYGLKPPDAIHVITAQTCECDVLQTYDGEIRDERGERKRPYLLDLNGKIGNPPLKIEIPKRLFADRQGSLFETANSHTTDHCLVSVLGWLSRQSRQEHPLRQQDWWHPACCTQGSLARAFAAR
jgi:hypothetical protein